jgi:hypothetical protein
MVRIAASCGKSPVIVGQFGKLSHYGQFGPQYTENRITDDPTKVGKKLGEAFYYIFGPPQLSLGPVAGNFHTIPNRWVKFIPCHTSGAFIRLGTINKIDKRIALKNAL